MSGVARKIREKSREKSCREKTIIWATSTFLYQSTAGEVPKTSWKRSVSPSWGARTWKRSTLMEGKSEPMITLQRYVGAIGWYKDLSQSAPWYANVPKNKKKAQKYPCSNLQSSDRRDSRIVPEDIIQSKRGYLLGIMGRDILELSHEILMKGIINDVKTVIKVQWGYDLKKSVKWVFCECVFLWLQ